MQMAALASFIRTTSPLRKVFISAESMPRLKSVQGVESAFVTTFRRFGNSDNGELETGILPIGAWEIARLDNDPAFQERRRSSNYRGRREMKA